MPNELNNLNGFVAARQWAAEHGHEQPDDRMLMAYGAVLRHYYRYELCPRCGEALAKGDDE